MSPFVRFLAVLIGLGSLAAACGGGGSTSAIDGYVALVPRVLRAGETETVSLSLFSGSQLAHGDVAVGIRDGDDFITTATARIDGKGTIEIDVPPETSGDFEVVVTGPGFKEVASVQVQSGTLVFLETDKPIYKPGQTILMRVVALNSELKPVTTAATVEIQDAKGIKLLKRDVQTDEFGMATLELPLSTEPNLGVWKITTVAGDTSTDTDVRVEEYVLPKYEVGVEMTKDWFLVNETITGSVTAEYSFGKAVNGDLKVSARRYVGTWEEFSSVNAQVTDGRAEFSLRAPEYVAGVPEAGGLGNVQLDFTVTERNTGYEGKTTELVTVAAAPVNLQLIPESPVFKPGLPMKVLVVTETPSGETVDSPVTVDVYYMDENYAGVGSRSSQTIETSRGIAEAAFTPPEGAIRMTISGYTGQSYDSSYAYEELTAAYSPSGNFIHLEQLDPVELKVGSMAKFKVYTTSEARNFYYEVVSRDRVVFTGHSDSREISFRITPAMAPSARVLVYQILPTSEVAADFLPFEVEGAYPHEVTASFGSEESRPGDEVTVDVQTEGRAKVGLVAVDRSVYILAENRLNLQQVFAEIEQLYGAPQAELHDAEPFPGPVIIRGAEETFEDVGLIVLTDQRVPKGKELEQGFFGFGGVGGDDIAVEEAADRDGNAVIQSPSAIPATGPSSGPGLAEVQRVRQFFPETWIWDEIVTGDDGHGTLTATSPDSITTWDLRAVAVSPENGLGIAEAEHRVFQPFFLTADLPYSAIRGEEFPLKVSLYNYTDAEQEFLVEIEDAGWFDLLDDGAKTVTVGPNDTGGAEFRIRPTGVGTQLVEVTARGADDADALLKSMIVEPEGVQREQLENGVLQPGVTRSVNLSLPGDTVPDSARSYVAITGSFLAQTIQGLDGLLQMPFGCGEQNMINFAPDVYILDYLNSTNQDKPEIRAKAETFLITGYQRELTYQRSDGSFSAFGESDPEGSTFLTAFVLKTFAQAKDLTYIDESVLTNAADWLAAHQEPDGSFEPVGFLAHQELMGGVNGPDSLTAYAAIAMIEAGQTESAAKAIAFLEGRLDEIDDAYTLALVTYALELAGSGSAGAAYDTLIAAAEQDDDGLHWPGGGPEPLPFDERQPVPFDAIGAMSSDIEATGYALLALVEHGDQTNAAGAAKWLVSHRNSLGGFGSTQDTVVGLQALTAFAAQASADVDLTVTVRAGDITKQVTVNSANYDVTQLIDVPAGFLVEITAEGRGQAVFQAVTRFNLPAAEQEASAFDISVDFDTANIQVNDTVGVDVSVTFNPPEPLKAGMVVLDIAVPTGFAPVTDTLEQLVATQQIKRYDIAGRKVILYIEDMDPGETVNLAFDAIALYPVKAKGAASTAYSYYMPQLRGETIGEPMEVD